MLSFLLKIPILGRVVNNNKILPAKFCRFSIGERKLQLTFSSIVVFCAKIFDTLLYRQESEDKNA